MRLFIKSTSLDMWEMIETGDYVPMTEQLAPQGVANQKQPPLVVVRTIPRNEWTDQHKTKVQMNAKAKYLLTCALSKSEYNKIISCDLEKEIWDKLEVLHEGADQVKKTKINMPVHQCEMFKMLEHEYINEMTTRFMHYHKSAESLGKKVY